MSTFLNTIIQGDCLNILPQIEPGSVDFILTAPPTSRHTSHTRTTPDKL